MRRSPSSMSTGRISWLQDGAATAGDDRAVGNVLSNDTDVDATDTKTVTTPGTYLGTYGSLILAADGAYTYTWTMKTLKPTRSLRGSRRRTCSTTP